MEGVKSEGSSQGGHLRTTATSISLKNACPQELRECSVHLVSLFSNEGTVLIDKPLSRKPFTMKPGQRRNLLLVGRNLADVVSRPPHLLRAADKRLVLKDGLTYRLTLELRSEYEFPTRVTLLIATDERFARAEIAKQEV